MPGSLTHDQGLSHSENVLILADALWFLSDLCPVYVCLATILALGTWPCIACWGMSSLGQTSSWLFTWKVRIQHITTTVGSRFNNLLFTDPGQGDIMSQEGSPPFQRVIRGRNEESGRGERGWGGGTEQISSIYKALRE